MTKKYVIGIIGAGYVGLPLALSFAKKDKVISYDENNEKINYLTKGIDKNKIFSKKEILNSRVHFTNNSNHLKYCNVYIVCVPTPVNKNNLPNLIYLKKASQLVGRYLKKKDLVIYESTVYPGCTEEFCIPLIEKKSNFLLNKDFYCGYSPERINPGDKKNKLTNIVKIISASSKKGLIMINDIYKKIIKADLHKAKNIKIAEAAKILENIQRSVNISLINEVSLIFRKLKINTHDVLEAANTKWNFANYRPGLVGGHCIAVDPYYLTYKAKMVGIDPKLILSGQKINNHIPIHIANRVSKKIRINKKNKKKILILGLAFKENCSDIRDSKVFNIIDHLKKKGGLIDIYDPWINKKDFKKKINFKIINDLGNKKYDAIILAVAHSTFKRTGFRKFNSMKKKNGFFYDVKSLFYGKKDVECL
jgi:UDP-N-acetyl-D-glucosamine/UDP-N-acetyl-D-galactosamine dehydrogenase